MDLVIINQPRVFPYQMQYHIVKRVIDVALCLLALPLALPLMVICALAVYLDSEGPVLFVQERIGKGGRLFRMYKFRTMQPALDNSYQRAFMKAFVRGEIGRDEDSDQRHSFMRAFVRGEIGRDEDSDQHHSFMRAFVDRDDVPQATSGALCEPENQSLGLVQSHGSSEQMGDNGNGKKIYKPAQAAQITQVGRLLRKTSLDELPQIINVLKGEMSLVGPRPNVPWEVEEYRPWHYERLEVLPGITGLAQVRGRSDISFDRIVKYDIEYMEKQSLAIDLKILWWTVKLVVDGKGAG